MIDQQPPSIVGHENKIAAELFPKIKDYLQLLGDAFNFAGLILETACVGNDGVTEEKFSYSKYVCTKLLQRLINDLRCVAMLAEVGYDMQANALAASIYEGVFTLATISDNEEFAKDWLKHNNPKVTYGNAYNNTVAGLANYGANADWIKPFYQVYSQFCWGKHLNPIAEQQGGVEHDGKILDWILGPRADNHTERGVDFCCAYSALFAIFGMDMYVQKHVPADKRNELRCSLADLAKRRETLYQAGLARWGSADPFPGKW